MTRRGSPAHRPLPDLWSLALCQQLHHATRHRGEVKVKIIPPFGWEDTTTPVARLPRGPRNYTTAPWPAFYDLTGLCPHRSPGGFLCSRFGGHTGRHAAYLTAATAGTRVNAVWP